MEKKRSDKIFTTRNFQKYYSNPGPDISLTRCVVEDKNSA